MHTPSVSPPDSTCLDFTGWLICVDGGLDKYEESTPLVGVRPLLLQTVQFVFSCWLVVTDTRHPANCGVKVQNSFVAKLSGMVEV